MVDVYVYSSAGHNNTVLLDNEVWCTLEVGVTLDVAVSVYDLLTGKVVRKLKSKNCISSYNYTIIIIIYHTCR